MPKSDKRVSKTPLLMVGLGVVLMVVAMVWSIGSSKNPSQSPVSEVQPTASSRIPYPNIKRVSPADVKAAVDLKNAVIIDTRGSLYYDEGHIPGAISMTEDELADRMPDLDRESWIITYCT